MDVDVGTLLRMRLAAQGLTGSGAGSVAEAVRRTFALQGQDLRQAEWAIGSRLPDATVDDVWAAFAAGEVVRSWPMRGTLFALAPDDLRLLLSLTAERQMAQAAPRHRQLGVTDDDVARATGIVRTELAGGGVWTRPELLAAFVAGGLDVAGQRFPHLYGRLAHTGVLCLGPPQGSTAGGPGQGFVLLDEWAPGEAPADRATAVATVVRRYLAGHGPATEKDLAWWTKLTLTEVRAAFAAVRDELIEVRCGDGVFWTLGEPPAAQPGGVLALAGFDELLLGYTDRSHGLAAEHADRVVPGKNGVFFPMVTDDGRVVGTWRRLVARGRTAVQVSPFQDVPDDVAARYERAAAKVLTFRGEA